jgi:multiple sugar transport system substrate-binding protein
MVPARILCAMNANSTIASGRRRTRRGALLAGAGALAGAALTACVPGRSGEEASKSTEPVTLRWSTWGDDKHVFNTTAAPRGLELFKQRHPNVTVNIEVQMGTDWVQKNATEWIAGDGPDLTGHCCEYGITYDRQGFLLGMDPYIKKDSRAVPTGDYVEWLLKLFSSQQSGQFALPMYTGTIGLLYSRPAFRNKNLPFPDDTWDWNTYRQVSQRLTDAQAEVWGREILLASHIYRRIYANGGDVVDPKDDTKAAFASEKAIQAMEVEKTMAHREKSAVVTGGPKKPESVPALQPRRFVEGKIAMFEGASFGLVLYLSWLEEMPDWDIAPLPRGPAGRATLATNDGWSIWKGSKKRDTAWELMKFLQTDEWTDIATRVAGQQSARKSFQQKWATAIKEANPRLADKNLKPFTEAIEKGYARPNQFFRKHPESWAAFEEAYIKSVRDGDEEVGAAMRAAAERVNQINRA